MRRIETVLLVAAGVALALACGGASTPVCDDCGPCPDSFEGDVTRADRADLAGAKLVIGSSGVDVVYDVSGSTFQASYAYGSTVP